MPGNTGRGTMLASIGADHSFAVSKAEVRLLGRALAQRLGGAALDLGTADIGRAQKLAALGLGICREPGVAGWPYTFFPGEIALNPAALALLDADRAARVAALNEPSVSSEAFKDIADAEEAAFARLEAAKKAVIAAEREVRDASQAWVEAQRRLQAKQATS